MQDIHNLKNLSYQRLRRSLLIREGISLITLDHRPLHLQDKSKTSYLNRMDHCFVFHYTHLSQCIKHLKKASSREYIILLFVNFNKDKIQTMSSQFNQYRRLQAVFTMAPCENRDDAQNNISSDGNNEVSHHTEIKAIQSFEEWDPLYSSLQNLITETQKGLRDIGLFTTCTSPEKALRDLKHELGSFVWTHTFRVLLVDMPHNSSEAKRQMIRECRRCYRHNLCEMKNITEFQKTYRPCEAIKWYTRSCFLSTLVNRTLRSKNVYALYIFRYFIFDLCESLVLTRYQDSRLISVYRGTILHRDEVEQIRVGSLVSSNGFLSSSLLPDVSLMFTDCNSSRNRADLEQFVLFTINIDMGLSPDVVVADISGESYMPHEKEFLFDLGTTFIITDIEHDKTNSIWKITMTGSNEVAQRSRMYDAYMRERLSETSATILFGRMLAHLSEYSLGIKYFHRLLRVLPVEHEDRPGIHYQLARMYRFLGKHQQALHYFQCAKLLQRRDLPYKTYEYGMILAGMGTVYMEMNDSKRAIDALEQASICYNLDSKIYNTETIFHFNRLSYAYYLEQQYERALQLINKTLVCYKEKMPADHPGHAQTYHNLGLVHRVMGNKDEALVSFKEALRMREALLAPHHPYVARTCYQMSLLFEELADHKSVLDYAQKALRIQILKLPSNHPELELSNELVTQLTTKTNPIV